MTNQSDGESSIGYLPDIPICDLSFNDSWTPMNRIFFSQCINEEAERTFCPQQKKWRRKRSPFKNEKMNRKYIIYKYVSSGSEVSTSDEFSSADEHEGRVKKRRLSDKCRSNSESETYISDEYDTADEKEVNLHSKLTAVQSRKHTNKNKSFDKCTPTDDYDSSSDCDSSVSSGDSENNMRPNLSVLKSTKYTNYKSVSYDEWKMSSSGDYSVSISSSDCENNQLSEYEKMVQKNRDEKMAFLKSLKVFEAVDNLKEAVKTETKGKGRSNQSCMREIHETGKTKAVKKIEKAQRISLRQKSGLKEKQETFASSQSSNTINAQRISRHQKRLLQKQELPSVLSFEEALLEGHTYHDFISEIRESEFRIQHLQNDYVSHFDKMSLQKSQTLKHNYGRSSSMAFHESQEKIILCIGVLSGEIIFRQLNMDSNVCIFQPHRQRVSNLKFSPYFPNVLISSSIDGTMRYGDFEKKVFYQVFEAESVNHFDILSATSCLVSNGIKYVSVIDIRSPSKTFEKRHECCEDVKTVSLHPVNKNYFLSSHKKGIVKLWDLRKLQKNPVTDFNCKGGNMMSSYFSPISGNSILVTLSSTISLLNSSSLNEEFTLKKSIEHENGGVVGRAPLKATWVPNTDNVFVVGSNSSPRRIEIFDDKLCNFFNFTSECLEGIPTVNVFHSSVPILASATKGNIFIFSEIE
ncbi:WD repeat-containing protein 76-like isoform X2 [Argiope bruennichi]|uniref:WD repeat-containing protein 76-like isoform X2 n=1 Tax=Argiope bruennichi TaxID=94029 RepID=UPI002494DAB3|nr:WD repeat-containing protein 76-like isoform X2 [Argiope bruennichi]